MPITDVKGSPIKTIMSSSSNNNGNDDKRKASSRDTPSLEMGNNSNGNNNNADSKSKAVAGGTVRTCIESSEEFTLSAELSAASSPDEGFPTMLQLSGISIVNDNNDSKAQPQQQQQQSPATANPPVRLSPTAEVIKGVHFDDNVHTITDEEIFVPPPCSTKKSKKKKKKEQVEAAAAAAAARAQAAKTTVEGEGDECKDGSNDEADVTIAAVAAQQVMTVEAEVVKEAEVPKADIWWTAAELETMELNAMYMVRECQQYQEEVVCTVLYNKAFLTAQNLAKTIPEDELEERLQNISLHAHSLESWTAVGQSRRGLECMVSEKAVEDAVQCRTIVLQFQQELRVAAFTPPINAVAATVGNGSSTVAQSQPPNVSQHAAFLAKRYQDSSRAARIMARMMGAADRESLAKADEALSQVHSLPEPPGTYDHNDYYRDDSNSSHTNNNTDSATASASPGGRTSRANRKTGGGGRNLLKPIRKAVGAVFRRQPSEEVHKKRILRMQQKQMQAAEPPKRQSEEFRRSFLETLDYGDQ